MFNFKAIGVLATILAAGASYSAAQINQSKIAPLTTSDKALKKCELHGAQLQLGTVPITYGIVSGAPAGYYQASDKAFPHARSFVSGGCVISKDSPKMQTVKFCPQCRTAEKQWLAKNHKASHAN